MFNLRDKETYNVIDKWCDKKKNMKKKLWVFKSLQKNKI